MDGPGFDIVVEPEARLARLSGELDLASCDRAADAIAPLLEGTGDVELDLSGLRFTDSSGLRVFVQANTELGGRGSLVLLSPNPHVAKILEIAGVADLGIEIRSQ
jgi:anti-anti-sigma factor